MTNENRKAANAYLREVRRALFCRRSAKRALLASLSPRVWELARACNVLTQELLCAKIGTPEEIAGGMMTAEDLARLKRHERRLTFCKAACLAAVALAAVVIAVCLVTYYNAIRQVEPVRFIWKDL